MKNFFIHVLVKIVVIFVFIFISVCVVGISAYALLKVQTKIRIIRAADNLLSFSSGFKKYEQDNGLLPADTHNFLPAGMAAYIDPDDWNSDALGGHYNWEGPYWGEKGGYEYAGISLFGTTASMKELILLDRKIDDGNLASGKFRQTPNGRYTYVFEERP